MLKPTYATEAEVPAALREHYAEADGKWHVQVEGHRERINALNAENKGFRQRAERAEAELALLKPEAEAIRQHERETILAARLSIALEKGRVIPEHAELLSEKLAQRIKIVPGEDSKRVVQIDGARDFDDLVAQAHKQWPGAFFGSGGYGGGAPPHQFGSGSGAKSMTRAEFNALSPDVQMAKMQAGWGLHDD